MPVPLKQAVANAAEFAAGVLGNRAGDVRLEEVESLDNNGSSVWLITLSMIPKDHRDPEPADQSAASGIMASMLRRPRDYKTFTVRKETGEVTAMKIREFAGE
jgi:hypothetical protein